MNLENVAVEVCMTCGVLHWLTGWKAILDLGLSLIMVRVAMVNLNVHIHSVTQMKTVHGLSK